ncbi:hypothetical protein E4U42_007532 [Claviceps africana]|uniref:Zinc finger C2H2 LYAR-type domain-containing protein n=1 Tax=Claviceps africana TaxID=83212 RepID=A0A8K0JB96_9HYPO|nr:hypothetical protein E4U42_007532 [Claviceps africana]
MVHFPGVQYRSHTSCISEDQKYQGALYKDKSKKAKNNSSNNNNSNNNNNNNNGLGDFTESQPIGRRKTMLQQAYVEDVGEARTLEPVNDSLGQTDTGPRPIEALPEAPTPPAAATEEHVNVFDFMVATGQTPNASNTNLAISQHGADFGENTSLVRYEHEPEQYRLENDGALIKDGAGHMLAAADFTTPAPKTERRRNKDSELKKDKKRKRPHADVPGDQVMTDAPPVQHTQLTDNMKRMLRYPPSPDYSGGDANENSPASPLKKSKHSKHAKGSQNSNSLFGMITGGVKKSSKKKTKKDSHRHYDKKEPKLIKFGSHSKDGNADGAEGQIVVFKPRATAFLSFVNKGPESEKGCSMNKALKRFHRERQAAGSYMTKAKEEKELWRTLRMRRNESGEIVLFTIEDEH